MEFTARIKNSGRFLFSPVSVPGKPFFFGPVHGIIAFPRPATNGASVIPKGFLDFGLGVHDERPVLRDGLPNGFGLQQKQFRLLRPVGNFDRYFIFRMAWERLLIFCSARVTPPPVTV